MTLLESLVRFGVAVLFAAQRQARNSSFRDQERIASCVFALASTPVVKRNIGSTTRAARDFRGPSGKNFAGAVLAAFV